MHHPWRRLRDLPHVTLDWHDGGLAGLATHSTQTASIRIGQSQVERRVAICHEVVHLERGAAPVGHVARDEAETRQEVARRLIDLHALGEALAWARPGDHDEAADELWVTVDVLRDRLAHLHPSERAYLKRRLSAGDGTVDAC